MSYKYYHAEQLKPSLLMLGPIELYALSTPRLLNHLRSVEAVISAIETYRGDRCCELCHEYIGNDWGKDVGQYSRPVRQYKVLLKLALAGREHVLRKAERGPKYKKLSKARLRFTHGASENKAVLNRKGNMRARN